MNRTRPLMVLVALVLAGGCTSGGVGVEADAGLCGNGVLDPGEMCDDGNVMAGDGCAVDCTREDGCGDAILEGTEQCDDGNNVNGDGCSDDCQIE